MTEKSLTPEERCLIAAANEAIKRNGEDKARLADAVGISQVLLTRVLNGQSRMSAGTWKKICAELGLDYDEVCEKMSTPLRDARAVMEGIAEGPAIDPVKLQKQIEDGPSVVSNEPEKDYVKIKAPPEELYRLFLFAEERLQDNLRLGTRMPAEELYRLMQTLYAMRDAALALQPGEVVAPSVNTEPEYNRKTVYD